MTDLHLVVFDVDGTLVDSQDFIVRAMTRAFDGMGLAVPDRARILSIVGLSLPEAIADLYPDLGPSQLAEAVAGYRESFLSHRKESGGEAIAPMFPGARAALDRLAARDEMLLGVATGKARRGLMHFFDGHGLNGMFQTTQTADDHPSKPHPSMLLAALSETGVDAGRAVMVGDTSFDIRMGRAAGLRTVGVAWGYHPVDDLHAAGADIVIEEFDALDAALDRLWGAPA